MKILPVGAELYQADGMFEIGVLRRIFRPKKRGIKRDLKETARETASSFVSLTKC